MARIRNYKNKAGDQFWHKDGELHRENGPAVMYVNNSEDNWWYLDGDHLSFKEWCAKLNKTRIQIVTLKLIYG